MLSKNFSILLAGLALAASSASAQLHPYAQDVADQSAGLRSSTPTVRAAAAEALGYLRAHDAADALAVALADDDASVRREAAMALAWCGSRRHVAPLLEALDDADWTVRQTAHVALQNLTGMELPFDALAAPDVRDGQAKRWRSWWAGVGDGQIPKELTAALGRTTGVGNLARGCTVTVSGTYKGPPNVLTDGRRVGFWQTKNVPFPQWCTVDLGRVQTVARVIVRQYDKGFCMTKWEVSASADGKAFETVQRGKRLSPVDLTVSFAPRKARYIRITSHATERSIYPTTFREIEAYATADKPDAAPREQTLDAKLRAVRALGSLGGEGAAERLAATVEPYRNATTGTPPIEREIVRAALRSLGRLRDPASLKLLTDLLDNPLWARYAADALGVFGDDAAAAALIAAYPPYARSVTGKAPKRLPRDDHPGLTPDDRMYETPFAIASALSVLPLKREQDIAALREIAPVLAANVPQDHDGAMLYEPEANRRVTAWLLERAGMRQAVCEAAFVALGQPRRGQAAETDAMAALAKRMNKAAFAAGYLPALCTDKRDVPRLIALLQHKDGWARINAAKALMFLDERSAIGPIAKLLAASKAEADFGFFGGFVFYTKQKGQDEYNDPPPRWREAFVRALGRLGGTDHVPLLARLLRDERSALEIQAAAATALDELGTPDALAALQAVEPDHPYHSIRLIAREALWRRGLISADASPPPPPAAQTPAAPSEATTSTSVPEAVVFIRGDNKMPNRFQIDAWRQTYSTTDSGPTYRLGRNLYVLRPARPGGTVTPLTTFPDGYVADCEVSWDGRRVIFAKRGGKDDPWWHIWEIGVDGTGLRQITKGPYHDVQPAYLGDGRIVLSTSRIGMRDEYHGYLATGLAVMNADGGGLRCVGFNLGRDNEPSVLPDGRILFSRLDLFYSRLKTELTVQAVAPDGTRNVTLYGPERRDFWRQVTRTSGEKGWGEVPPRHRVLRLTQPQALADGRILCASTGGLVAVGPSRYEEQFLPHDKSYAVTSPFPLPDGRILCAASKKEAKVDLGLYLMDATTGKLVPLYNDPATAEFEPRPVLARPRPAAAAEAPVSRAYTARLFCNSAAVSLEPEPARRGRLVRVIEGQPIFGRHATHRSSPVPGWKNHTGTHARILGTVPLAADGSFFLEVPADRLVHLQVLDADRQVVGNQLVWMYARPGETRSCVGCHEYPDSTAPRRPLRQAAAVTPIPCLPTGGEFSYRAKVWNKGTLTEEAERRTRTVHAVNLLARP
jgi:HEAT repeat protein